MDKNHGGGIELERGFDDFAGVDAGPVDGTPEHLAQLDNPVPVVQEKAPEDLVFEGRKARDQIAARRRRVGKNLGAQQAFFEEFLRHIQNILFRERPLGSVFDLVFRKANCAKS